VGEDGFEVVQNVLVLDAVVDGSTVDVDVYGSASNVCGTVRIELPEPAGRLVALRQLRRWRHHDTPLTLIVRASAVALQNDHAVFGAQMAPSP
jgi:hypothetical protein